MCGNYSRRHVSTQNIPAILEKAIKYSKILKMNPQNVALWVCHKITIICIQKLSNQWYHFHLSADLSTYKTPIIKSSFQFCFVKQSLYSIPSLIDKSSIGSSSGFYILRDLHVYNPCQEDFSLFNLLTAISSSSWEGGRSARRIFIGLHDNDLMINLEKSINHKSPSMG